MSSTSKKSKPIPTSSNNMLESVSYEAHRKFRYKVFLPQEFMCVPEAIQQVALPTFTNCGCWFRNPWSDLELRIIQFIGPDALYAFHKNMKLKNFTIKIEQLDPINIAISTWIIKCQKITSMDYGSLTYQDEGFNDFVVRFKVVDMKQEFIEITAAK